MFRTPWARFWRWGAFSLVCVSGDWPCAGHERQSLRNVGRAGRGQHGGKRRPLARCFRKPPLKFAVLAKTTRNATIGFVVLAYAIYWARKSNTKQITNKAAFLWQKFPKFCVGLSVDSLLATLKCSLRHR